MIDVWIYQIRSGRLCHAPRPDIGFECYAGRGVYRDDPGATQEVAKGPIPVGVYTCGKPQAHPRLGPVAIFLDPNPANKMFGRSGFFIHGDNSKRDFSASNGCIVAERAVRERFRPGDRLVVVP